MSRSKGNGYGGGRMSSGAASFSNQAKRGGFLDRMRVKMVYTDNPTLSSTTVPGVQVYRGNGIFDPDFTGTGLQPALYDDYSTIYNQYRVMGAKITVSGVSTSATTIGRMYVQARNTSSGSATATAFLGACANPYSTDGLLGPNGMTGFCDGKNSPLGTALSINISTARIIGLSQQAVLGSDNVASVFSTTPNEPWYFHVSAIHQDLSTSATYRLVVTIEYDVEWFDQVTQSLDLEQQLQRFIKRFEDKKIREQKFYERVHNREGFQLVTENAVPQDNSPSYSSSAPILSARATYIGPLPMRR